MLEEKEKNGTSNKNADSNNENIIDKTIDVLRLVSTIGQSIAGFLGAMAFVELELSAVNSWLSARHSERFEYYPLDTVDFNCKKKEV